MRVGLPPAAARPLAGLLGRWALSSDLPVETQRRRMELAGRALPAGRGVTAVSATLGGVACERVSVGHAGVTLLYLHGGAYVVGSPRTHRGLAANLARRIGATAWVLDYRLAPEHPYPAALDDALAAYRVLAAGPGPIVVAGESAGGGLTLALAMAVRDAGERPPHALGLMSPWLDPATDVRGARPPAPREPLLDPAVLRRCARDYAGDHDVADSGISPLRGNLRGLPPIVLSSAGDDVLMPDAEKLERRARRAGARLVHQRHPGMWHAFHAFAPVMPAAADALDELAAGLEGGIRATEDRMGNGGCTADRHRTGGGTGEIMLDVIGHSHEL